MKGINEIAKHDARWRTIALKITENKTTADDLVQDMYLKLMDKDKELSNFYIVMTLTSIFMDSVKLTLMKNRTQGFAEGFDVEDESVSFEPDDKQQRMLNRISKLPYHQREFVELTHDYSFREIGEDYNINYGFVYKEYHNALSYVLGENGKDKLYSNDNLKILKAKKNNEETLMTEEEFTLWVDGVINSDDLMTDKEFEDWTILITKKE
jgi:RNA polymerase sigma factor (sigma-70 family)